ncbi:MAG: CPBP family intramembrane metalloprotease [Bacteroidales bacterium]|nr:CPBP family intramembrane metalloprotease [Bacteroidales bacterium]
MFREPPFRDFSPFLKILALIAVMIVTFLMVLALGVAISIPFFGKGILTEIATITDYQDDRILAALKYFQIVNQIGLFILPAILFVILTDDHVGRYLNLDMSIKRFSTLFGCIVLVISLPFINWMVMINNNIALPEFLSGVEEWMRRSEENARLLTEAFLSADTWKGFLINLVMIGGLAAVGEELIFRGILVRLFREWTKNVHLAVIIPALLFSALHMQFYGFFGRLALGIMLGYLFVWSGSLWVPVLVHFFNNAMAVILSFADKKGLISVDLEQFGASQNVWVIIGSVALSLFSLGLIYLHEKGYFKKKRLL